MSIKVVKYFKKKYRNVLKGCMHVVFLRFFKQGVYGYQIFFVSVYKIFFFLFLLFIFGVHLFFFLLFYVVEDVNIQMIPFYVLSHAKIKLGNIVSSVFSCITRESCWSCIYSASTEGRFRHILRTLLLFFFF